MDKTTTDLRVLLPAGRIKTVIADVEVMNNIKKNPVKMIKYTWKASGIKREDWESRESKKYYYRHLISAIMRFKSIL